MTDLIIPQENANDEKVRVSKILFENENFIKKGDVILEYETSKAEVEFESPVSGWLSGFEIKVDDYLVVGEVFAHISSEKNNFEKISPSKTNDIKKQNENFITVKARDLSLKSKKPIKDSIWLTSKDFVNESESTKKPSIKEDSKIFDKIKIPFEKKELNFRKKKEIEYLGRLSNYFNSTHGIEIVGKREFNETFIQNSILDLVCYEIYKLLSDKFTDLNSFYFDSEHIAIFKNVIPGIALDNSGNLVVVKIEDLNSLNSISNNILKLIDLFSQNKLEPKYLSDCTFTITDLSNSSNNFVLPLLNGYQSFIIAICQSKNGFNIFGTFDHRVTEGKRFSLFLNELKTRVESYLNVQSSQEIQKKVKCFYCDLSLEFEIQKGHKGFSKIFDGRNENLICRNCLDGW